jgi:hypothetical protein
MRLLALIAALLVAAPAGALEFGEGKDRVTLDITEALFLDYHSTLDDTLLEPDPTNVFDLRNRLGLRLRWQKLAAGLRLDAAYFPTPPLLGDGSTLYGNDIRPEEFFISYKFGKLKLTLGDDYVSLGRGMALSIRKVDDLGFAMSLRGLHLHWRNKLLNLRVTTGFTNVVNVDGVEEKLLPDPHDFITGIRLEARPFKWLRLGGHFVDIERRFSPLVIETNDVLGPIMSASGFEISGMNPKPVRTMITGASLEIPDIAGKFGAYFEGNYMLNSKWHNATNEAKESLVRLEDDDGYAFYGSLTGYLGRWTILAEGKHYKDYKVNASPHPQTYGTDGLTQISELQYISAPTLERIDQRWQENANVTGAHLKIDHRLPVGNNRLFLSQAFFYDAPAPDEYTIHAYAGWEHKTEEGDRYLLQMGYRAEEAPGQKLATRLRMFHIDLDCYINVAKDQDLQLHMNHEFRSMNPGGGELLEDEYLEGTAYLSWNIAPSWSFTAQFEYLTSKLNCGTDGCAGDMWWYPGAFVVYRIDQSSFVRVFAGRGKGGLKCSGGVCRIYPDFEGVKLDTTLRF